MWEMSVQVCLELFRGWKSSNFSSIFIVWLTAMLQPVWQDSLLFMVYVMTPWKADNIWSYFICCSLRHGAYQWVAIASHHHTAMINALAGQGRKRLNFFWCLLRGYYLEQLWEPLKYLTNRLGIARLNLKFWVRLKIIMGLFFWRNHGPQCRGETNPQPECAAEPRSADSNRDIRVTGITSGWARD